MISLKSIKTLFIGLSVILLYFLPNFIFGENSKISFVDNLDSNIVWIKILLANKIVFVNPNENINQILNGVPRSSIYSFYDISILWFNIFGIYWGYVINKIIMSFVGFIGVYFLQKEYFKKFYLNDFVTISISLIFALQPFWSFNLTIAGLPLLLFVFLELHNNSKNNFIWIYIFLFPFYSSLFLSGIFIILLFFILELIFSINSKSINIKYYFTILLISFLYLASHYPVFYTFFNTNYVSHRTEFISPINSFTESLFLTIKLFLLGQLHSGGVHFLYFPVLLTSFFYQLKNKKFNKIFIYISIFIIITSFYFGFIHNEIFYPFSEFLFKILPIQTQRFYFLHPIAWMLLLIISSYYFKNKILILKLILLTNLFFLFSKNEIFSNSSSITFKKYYAINQFRDINKYINTPLNDFKVINIGIEPAVSQFNGFYTLDGYLADYPLTYKKTFRKVIAKELDRSENLKNYYDKWGSRCYSFSSELDLQKLYTKGNNKTINNLFFDFKLLKNMGCRYLISGVKINLHNNKNLLFEKKFISTDSEWDIYLYKII
jgi:hypothetical protein